MKRRLMVAGSVVLAAAAYAQVRQPPNWDWYRIASPLFRGVEEQLLKEGLRLSYDKVEMQDFGGLFVTAILPVRGGSRNPAPSSGTFAILVVFARTPGMPDPPIVEVVRLDYYKRDPRTRAATIEGKLSDIAKDGTTRFGERVLVLEIDVEGRIAEKVNQLIFERVGWKLKENCTELMMKSVSERCRQESYLDWLGCRFGGWLWVKKQCYEYLRK